MARNSPYDEVVFTPGSYRNATTILKLHGSVDLQKGPISYKLGKEWYEWVEGNSTLVHVSDVHYYDIGSARERMLHRRIVQRASNVLSWLEFVFPNRIANEEIGDALELIHRIADDPACSRVSLKVTIKLATTIFWVVINSIRLISSSLRGKKAE